jgi:Flp pilus assembly protein TadB
MENLIKLIREHEQGDRQLRAMTGETRITAWILGALPLGMVGYFLLANPVTCWPCGATAMGRPCCCWLSPSRPSVAWCCGA